MDVDDRGVTAEKDDHRETVLIKTNADGSPKCPGTYKFYLNNFSAASGGTDNFPSVIVEVKKYDANTNVTFSASYTSDDSGGSKFWRVFSLDSSGSIENINAFDDNCGNLIAEIGGGTGSGKCSNSSVE